MFIIYLSISSRLEQLAVHPMSPELRCLASLRLLYVLISILLRQTGVRFLYYSSRLNSRPQHRVGITQLSSDTANKLSQRSSLLSISKTFLPWHCCQHWFVNYSVTVVFINRLFGECRGVHLARANDVYPSCLVPNPYQQRIPWISLTTCICAKSYFRRWGCKLRMPIGPHTIAHISRSIGVRVRVS